MLSVDIGGKGDARDRLRDGMLQALAREGMAGVSARQLAKAAGVSPSAINYHFGGIEHLFREAQALAVDCASEWLARRRAALPRDRVLPLPALAAFLTGTIDDWCREAPDLAYAWRECQIAAQRQADMGPLAQAWHTLWLRFWREVGAAFGLQETDISLLAIFFDAESFLHLIDWERSIDQSALTEICQRFVARLQYRGSHVPGPSPWRRLARERSGDSVSLARVLPPTAEKISQGILTVIGEQGVAGLTHRGVALRAGATLGAVAYYFNSRADLLHAGFLAAYHNIVRPRDGRPDAETPPLSLDDFRSGVVATVIEPGPALANVRAIDEILLAGARDGELRAIAAYLRYSRGETTIHSIRRMPVLRDQTDDLDCAIISGCVGGIRRSVCWQSPAQQRETAAAFVLHLLHLFASKRR